MKKFFTLVLASVLCVAAFAQKFELKKNLGMNFVASSATATAAAAEDEALWGYYTGDASGFGGLGTGKAGTFRVAIFVPGVNELAGAKITAVNVPILSSKSSSVSVWGGTTVGSKTAFNKTAASVTAGAYNKVVLDEPVEIPATGLYVGYTFSISQVVTTADQYPIAVVQDGETVEGSIYLATSGTGSLTDYHTGGYGYSALQIFVEGMQLPLNALSIISFDEIAVASGAESKLNLLVCSNSKNAVNSFDYILNIDGEMVEAHKTLDTPIPAGLKQYATVSVDLTAPEVAGAYASTFSITHVNGAINEVEDATFAFDLSVLTRIVPRISVVEEFTGTGCGYCPRGYVGMEAVKEQLSDKAIVIAWHNYNSSDAMYQSSYANLGFDGAPQCAVDRKVKPDPYYGMDEEGILECVGGYNTASATVAITAEARFSEDNKSVVVKSNTEFLTDVSGYTIAFALTADSLTGTTSGWKQTNYYYQYTAGQAGIISTMPDLAKFCSGGVWGKSSVALVFNDALIGHTYASGKSKIPAFTEEEQVAGNIATSEYTINMPTKTTLVNALRYDKVYANIIVVDKNGQIANAARVRVLGAHEGIVDDDDKDSIYSQMISPIDEENQIMGETASPNMKFVAGTNYATFGAALWNVETGEVKDYQGPDEGASFHAVNNDGFVVGDDGNYAFAVRPDGSILDLFYEVGETVETDWGTTTTGDQGSSAWGISEDGKVIAGYYFDASWSTTACLWNENGERTDLPQFTEEDLGFEVSGSQVRWMTPDAKVLLGFVMDNYSSWPAVVWRMNESGEYVKDAICKNFYEEDYNQGKPYMLFHPIALSENGKWVSLVLQNEFDWNSGAGAPAETVGRLNLETMSLDVLSLPAEMEGTPMESSGIANDGTVLLFNRADGMVGRSGYMWTAEKQLLNLDEMLSKIEDFPAIMSNTPCCISCDGNKIEGFCISTDGDIFSYVVTLSEEGGTDLFAVESVTLKPAGVYNLQGVRVNDTKTKGIYVVDGKKIMK